MTWFTDAIARLFEGILAGLGWVVDSIYAIIAAVWSVLSASLNTVIGFIETLFMWALQALFAIPRHLFGRIGDQMGGWLTDLYGKLDAAGWAPPFAELAGYLTQLQGFWADMNYFLPLDESFKLWASAMTLIYNVRLLKFAMRFAYRLSPFGWFGASA